MSKSNQRRSASLRWIRGLAESATPIFLLDAKRRLVLFNAGCTEWTGWNSADVLFQACDYLTEPDPHSLEAVLAACAPPAEVWQGEPAEVPGFIPHQMKSPRQGRVRFQPLLDADQKVSHVLGQFLPSQPANISPSSSPSHLLHAELAALRQQVRSRYGEGSVVARSPAMSRILAQLALARQSSVCVLFRGQPGAGREHLARVLHQQGARSKQAFVPIDCRRSTGAELKHLLKHLRDDRQEMETLRTGTLFFRDIPAAPLDVQERIAEWLSEHPESQRPRVMAAATESLAELVEEGSFNQDLYFQLTTLVIDIPPLADRPEDILPLAQFFIEERNRHADRQLGGFDPQAMELIRRYRWPGNIAELRETVHAAAEQASGPVITPADFPLSFRAGQDSQHLGPPPATRLQSLEVVLADVERDHIRAALAACRENLSKAAELLGLSRPKLYRRLEALGLLPDRPEQK